MSCYKGFNSVVISAWSEWSDWSQCAQTCGTCLQSRKRTCEVVPPSSGAPSCEDSEKLQNLKSSETKEFLLPAPCGMHHKYYNSDAIF